MKRLIQVSSLFIFVFTLGTLTSSAQTTSLVKVDIPFEFNVGKTVLSAGKYSVRVVPTATSTSTVALVDESGKTVARVLGTRSSGRDLEQTELVFTRVGELRYLSEILFDERTVTLPVKEERSGRGASGN